LHSPATLGSDATVGKDSPAVSPAIPRIRSEIVKLSQRKMPHSLRLAFSDRGPGRKTDTVIIFIMVDTLALSKPALPAGPNTIGLTSSPLGKTTHPADTSHTAARTGGPNPDIQAPAAATTANSGDATKQRVDTVQKKATAKSALPFVNSDCHDFATDYDVDKLRVKMLESSRDEDRIQAARKVFRSKCFNTRQLKALSEVFTTDGFKFRFFETAYPFAADDRFRDLGATLADPVYSSKFKAMTGQQ
jgi:hypothetical protein